MRNILLTLRFVGTNYHGSQIQKNALSIQEVFQTALERALGTLPDVKLCSRTDSGVHAERFYISFKTESALPCESLTSAVNFYLPGDIAALEAREVPEDFHARYSALEKVYIYRVYNSRVMDPFLLGRALQFAPHIDERKLDGISKAFVGTHDFRAFCSIKTDAESTVRSVKRFEVRRRGELVEFETAADGFLYNMVRIMTGALLNCARGKLSHEEIEQALTTGRRSNLLATAPACGLYLADVLYELEPQTKRQN
ncbi:MAG: tRNA pseudouridine(38-40) synthase TruA [Oscillospiraceae bacterium]|nr:tRNA pseudouridine(38-40) synthase TruA [Oscillospiraceae bacterium]